MSQITSVDQIVAGSLTMLTTCERKQAGSENLIMTP
jgi:hypothetical protein